jgi:hypothetical protein
MIPYARRLTDKEIYFKCSYPTPFWFAPINWEKNELKDFLEKYNIRRSLLNIRFDNKRIEISFAHYDRSFAKELSSRLGNVIGQKKINVYSYKSVDEPIGSKKIGKILFYGVMINEFDLMHWLDTVFPSLCDSFGFSRSLFEFRRIEKTDFNTFFAIICQPMEENKSVTLLLETSANDIMMRCQQMYNLCD